MVNVNCVSKMNWLLILFTVVSQLHPAITQGSKGETEISEDPHRNPSMCEVCKFLTEELKGRLHETGKSKEVVETGHGLDTKKKKMKYNKTELRLIEALTDPHVCDKILQYNVHAERKGSNRFAKGKSQTMKTLQNLVDKGVQVDLGIPYEMWDTPSVSVAEMQRKCFTLVESYEEDIEDWYFSNQEEDLTKYLCQDRILKSNDQECLVEKWNPKDDDSSEDGDSEKTADDQTESKSGKIQAFVERQIELINTPTNQRVYSPDDLISAFSWYSRSRVLYTMLRSNLKLPSKSTLGKITRRVKNTDDCSMYTRIFQHQEERNKACAILVDEMYVKASVQYSGGMVYGFSEDKTNEKATTVLAVMVKCLFGGLKFLAKLVPCHSLTAEFLYEVVCGVIENIEQCGGKVITIINDNNRTNQAFFKLFNAFNSLSPWIVRSPTAPVRPMFLLYDPVHILKNIRNNWVTEKTKCLSFPVAGSSENALACWDDIVQLFHHENDSMVKLSKLTRSSVWPSNTEKQSVSLALRVFSDETSSALLTSSNSTRSWKNTALFINQVIKLWKLFNCKSPFHSARLNDRDRLVIDKWENGLTGMQLLDTWANIARHMRPTQGNTQRVHCFTKDTSLALEWTCKCLQDLCHYLLEIKEPWQHSYVCLGFFQQDDLERHFGHFRTSAGSNYYLSVKDVLNTHALDRTRLLLRLAPDLEVYDDKHHCSLCTMPLTDGEMLLLDDMTEEDLIKQISLDEKNAIVYIAGHVAFKNEELKGNLPDSSLTVYLNTRDRTGLCCPCEEFVEFMLHAYCFFINNKTHMCRTRLSTILGRFPNTFDINLSVSVKALRCISNIFMKRFALFNSQSDARGSSRKIAKLSSQ